MSTKRRFVRGFYGQRWKGVVLHTSSTILTILILIKYGKRLHQRKVITLNDNWIVNIKPFSIKWVDKSWFKWN